MVRHTPSLSAYDALVKIGEAARPQVAEALRAASPRLQINALAVLGRLGIEKSLPDIVAASKDKSPEVRSAALGALADSLDTERRSTRVWRGWRTRRLRCGARQWGHFGCSIRRRPTRWRPAHAAEHETGQLYAGRVVQALAVPLKDADHGVPWPPWA